MCSYDRASYGWSDPGPQWDTVEQVARDLETALKKASSMNPTIEELTAAVEREARKRPDVLRRMLVIIVFLPSRAGRKKHQVRT